MSCLAYFISFVRIRVYFILLKIGSMNLTDFSFSPSDCSRLKVAFCILAEKTVRAKLIFKKQVT